MPLRDGNLCVHLTAKARAVSGSLVSLEFNEDHGRIAYKLNLLNIRRGTLPRYNGVVSRSAFSRVSGMSSGRYDEKRGEIYRLSEAALRLSRSLPQSTNSIYYLRFHLCLSQRLAKVGLSVGLRFFI